MGAREPMLLVGAHARGNPLRRCAMCPLRQGAHVAAVPLTTASCNKLDPKLKDKIRD